MKKIISLLLSVMLMSTTVFASTAEEIAELYEKSMLLRSASAELVMETELNKPLDILDTIPQEDISDEADIDVKMIVESLTEAKTTMKYDTYISEDYKKMQLAMSMEFDVPVRMNSDFAIAAWTKLGMWMDLDVTDENNPVAKIIYKIPFMKKYMVMDMSENYKSSPEMLAVFDKDKLKEINDKAVEILTQNAEISKRGNEYTLKFTDETAKQYIYDILNLSAEIMPEETASDEEFTEMISVVKEFCDNITVFGQNGLTMKFTKNSSGYITAEEVDAHISINVYDILTYFSEDTNGLKREDAFIDMTFKTAATVTDHNKVTPVLPVITEDNSEIVPVIGGVDIEAWQYNDAPSAPIFKNNTVYYPVEEMALQCGLETAFDGNELTIKDGDTVFTVSNDEFETPEIITQNAGVYCTEIVLSGFNMYVHSARYVFDENSFTFSYRYEKPLIEEISEEEPEEDTYVSPTLYYDFYIDRLPYEKNGVMYMPVYEFVKELFDGEFLFGPGTLIYTANSENVFGIKTITARKGDSYLVVNEQQKPLDKAVEEKDGVLYIPVSFAKSIGLNATVNASYREGEGSRSNYRFHMPNPDYISPEYDRDDYIYMMKKLYYNIGSDRVPHMENGTVYIPAFDFINEIIEGEYTFKEGGFDYKASETNVLGIENISVNAGDKFITVNGEKREISNEVINIDNVLRLPISVISDFGMELTDININYGITSYHIEMENPLYTAEEETDGNWFSNLFGF